MCTLAPSKGHDKGLCYPCHFPSAEAVVFELHTRREATQKYRTAGSATLKTSAAIELEVRAKYSSILQSGLLERCRLLRLLSSQMGRLVGEEWPLMRLIQR